MDLVVGTDQAQICPKSVEFGSEQMAEGDGEGWPDCFCSKSPASGFGHNLEGKRLKSEAACSV